MKPRVSLSEGLSFILGSSKESVKKTQEEVKNQHRLTLVAAQITGNSQAVNINLQKKGLNKKGINNEIKENIIVSEYQKNGKV